MLDTHHLLTAVAGGAVVVSGLYLAITHIQAAKIEREHELARTQLRKNAEAADKALRIAQQIRTRNENEAIFLAADRGIAFDKSQVRRSAGRRSDD